MMVEHTDEQAKKPLLPDSSSVNHSGKNKHSYSKMAKSAHSTHDQALLSMNSVTTKPFQLSPRLLDPECPEHVRSIFEHIKATAEEHLFEFDRFSESGDFQITCRPLWWLRTAKNLAMTFKRNRILLLLYSVT